MLPEPLKLHFDQARETANDNRFKFPRLRSDMTKLSEQGRELILSLVLIDRADSLLAKNTTLLQCGHANPATLPMLEEAWKWIKTSKEQVVECARRANSARPGLMKKEWLELERQWLTILWKLDCQTSALTAQ